MSVAAAHPPFFIVGSARSGTTLLRLMFNAHEHVTIPPESRFIVELYDGRDVVNVARFLSELEAHTRFRHWDLPIEHVRNELVGRAEVPYRTAIEAAYNAYAHVHDKVRWGDKTPRYIEHIPFLASLWPDARFIHIIRDGRNVALSYADVPFGPKTVAKAASLWAERVSTGLRDGRALDPAHYIEFKYEDLVADIGSHAQLLCEFLDLSFDPGMLEYAERTRDDVMPWADANNPNVTKPVMKNVRSWEEKMPAEHVAIFEAIAGDLLAELGYEVRNPEPGARARLAAKLGVMGLPVGRLRSSR